MVFIIQKPKKGGNNHADAFINGLVGIEFGHKSG
jgi:hypothetical protein